ncbi:hypothetical protein GF336_03095 [Candidatus Woesearchaeota archaeon]|nr:hypothetical protein [Candidatus Woesearchaeota archaeon]
MAKKLESSVSSSEEDLTIDVSDVLEGDDFLGEVDLSDIPGDQKGAIDLSKMEDLKIEADNSIIQRPYSAEGFYLKGFYLFKKRNYRNAIKQFKEASDRSKSGRISRIAKRKINECKEYLS